MITTQSDRLVALREIKRLAFKFYPEIIPELDCEISKEELAYQKKIQRWRFKKLLKKIKT